MKKPIKTLYRSYRKGETEPAPVLQWRQKQGLPKRVEAALEQLFLEIYSLVYFLHEADAGRHNRSPAEMLRCYVKVREARSHNEAWKLDFVKFLEADFRW